MGVMSFITPKGCFKMSNAILVLESGRVFCGTSMGAEGEATGEVVFNTSMSGYQEILSDPSYAGQIVVMTAPQIGNTGVNPSDLESNLLKCRGFVVRESSPIVSSWRSEESLSSLLVKHGVTGIEGIDTRALTRCLRDEGAQRGIIATGITKDFALEKVMQSPLMTGQDLVKEVTTAETYVWDKPSWIAPDLKISSSKKRLDPFRVVAYDFGIKHNILRSLYDVNCEITVVPATMPAKEVLAMGADGFFLSNGPGDPAAVEYGIENVKELLSAGKPLFGICLGHQILSLALGARTYKLPFGHHGGNHPVMDLETKKVEITAQNHGFAVSKDELPENVFCSHINLYDDTVEGIGVLGKPVFGIQYHPEAGPGPHDASYLFQRFVASMKSMKF